MLPTGAGLTYDFKLSCHKVLPCGFHSESLRHKRQTCSIHLGRVQIKRRRTPPPPPPQWHPEPFFHFTSTIKRHERVFFGPTTMTMFTLFILFMNIAHDGYWKPWTVTWSDGGMGHTSETVSTTRAPVFPKRLMADETPPPLNGKSYISFNFLWERFIVLMLILVYCTACISFWIGISSIICN